MPLLSRRRSARTAVGPLLVLVVLGASALTSTGSAEPAGAATGTPVVASDPTITIEGRGFGHGVGMSQYGAYGMAQRGLTASQITDYYYAGTTVATAPQPSDIRVLVSTTASTVVTGSAAVGYYINGAQVAESVAGQRVTISAQGSSTVLDGRVQPAGTLIIGYNSSPLSVSASGAQYKWGYLAVYPSSGQLRLVVDKMTMDEYLFGLGEVPSSWPTAALEAQALTGRSYAKWATDSRRASDPTRVYDLDGSTIDQAYVGYGKEIGPSGHRWVAAVSSTSGRTVQHNGSTAQTFYSSSSGGHTEDSGYVFVTQLPYLRGRADPDDLNAANPNRAWTRSYSGTAMGGWVKAERGIDIGVVTSMQVSGSIGVSGRTDRATIRLTGTAGSTSMTGNAFYSMVNKRSTSKLPSKLFLLNPVGNVDQLVADVGGARLFGWSIDPSTTDPVEIHVYVNGGWGGSYRADASRPDVEAAYPGFGANHGFNIYLALPLGTQTVCAYAINVGAGDTNTPLGCRTISISGNPIGSLDGLQLAPGGLRVYGWALDPDTTSPVRVSVVMDGVFRTEVSASLVRQDVGMAYPSWGSARGFMVDVTAPPGVRQVCAVATNIGRGSASPSLGCLTRAVPGSAFGSLDELRTTSSPAILRGWAIDPKTGSPITVHLYVNGGWGGAHHAGASRPDVGAAYPAFGSAHGYEIPVTPGAQFCVYAIDSSGAGPNPLLGCRTG
jgi:SpoIID/LytB domain protein